MNKKIEISRQIRISRAAIIIVFLALIRCIGEIFRQHYYAAEIFTYEKMEPFLVGACITAVALMIMVILSFYLKHSLVIAIAILSIVALLAIKFMYAI